MASPGRIHRIEALPVAAATVLRVFASATRPMNGLALSAPQAVGRMPKQLVPFGRRISMPGQLRRSSAARMLGVGGCGGATGGGKGCDGSMGMEGGTGSATVAEGGAPPLEGLADRSHPQTSMKAISGRQNRSTGEPFSVSAPPLRISVNSSFDRPACSWRSTASLREAHCRPFQWGEQQQLYAPP